MRSIFSGKTLLSGGALGVVAQEPYLAGLWTSAFSSCLGKLSWAVGDGILLLLESVGKKSQKSPKTCKVEVRKPFLFCRHPTLWRLGRQDCVGQRGCRETRETLRLCRKRLGKWNVSILLEHRCHRHLLLCSPPLLRAWLLRF